ncbi:unnamed protein product [Caenorhabditis auriculariae]|uniref:glucuronosyltransferase n=1 Tax=Caenorhabditis auriculariae TaxID=2777116 RepID=A0A8S1HQT8_9PELO|nr:unnamed protein product [Caenorhabditis auriculariae]
MQFSATPHLVKQLKISDSIYGYYQTLFGVLQIVGGPFFGYIIQRSGIRMGLHVCYISTMLSGLGLYFSTDFTTLAISRIPVLFMHGQQGHQTLLSLLTEPGKERTTAFGRMGLTFGLGFVFTPILSILSTRLISDMAPLYVSAALCLAPMFILQTCIPSASYEHEKESCSVDEDVDKKSGKKSSMSIANVVRILKRRGVVNILLKKNAPIMPTFLIFSVLHLYMIDKFGTTNEQNQIIQLFIGIFIMFSNGFGVIWLRKKFDEQTLLFIGYIFFTVGFLMFAFFVNTWSVLYIMPFLSLGMSLVATVADSLLTSLVEEDEQGLALGTATSINSFVRTIAPMFAGALLQYYGFNILPFFGFVGSLSGLALISKMAPPRLLLLLMAISTTCAYKIVTFVPNMANSQVQFNARVAETLANAGHDVTMLFLSFQSDFDSSDVKIPGNVKKHEIKAFVPYHSKVRLEEQQAELIFQESSFDVKLVDIMKNMTASMSAGCRLLLRNKEFLNWLEAEKFDVAFAHIYNSCPIGLIHNAKIPSWVWLNSGALMDFVADLVGVPIIPSYTPPIMMESTDTMTFFERMKSFIGHALTKILYPYFTISEETQIFRDEIDPNFPHLLEIASKCPLVVVNTNEIYDNPRPTLDKVVNIGGLGVGFGDAKPLTGEFKEIAEKAEGMVVFSFGSVAAAHKMPEEWKEAFLEAFKEFPKYHFLLRYVEDDLKDRLPPNVHTFKWLPQKDLLLHKKTKALITHGGYNSLQEAISAGVPLFTIPLFGDQHKNAMMAKKHGFAVSVKKDTLRKESIVEALKKLLEDDSYSRNVKRLSAMTRSKPIPPATLLVRWTEFSGRVQDPRQLGTCRAEAQLFPVPFTRRHGLFIGRNSSNFLHFVQSCQICRLFRYSEG